MAPSKPHIFFLIILSIFSSSSPSPSLASLTTLIYKGCANQKFQDPSGTSTQNLQSLFTTLVSQSTTTNFHNATTGVYQCRGDLSNSDCNTCMKKTPEMIDKLCGGDAIAARVQLEGCYLRYAVVGFPPARATQLLYKEFGSGRVDGSGFDSRVSSAFEEVEKGVANGKGFYAGEYQSVYVMGQCEL